MMQKDHRLSTVMLRIVPMLFPLRNQKKEGDLVTAVAQWRKAEASLSSKDAVFTKMLSENRRLTDDLTEQNGQLENV